MILVDHNESKQTIDGMDDAEVLEIIDHHRFGDFESENPIFILVRPVGCVNTVIYGLYKTNHIKPSREIAGIMLSAIISDTVLSVRRQRQKKIKKRRKNWLKLREWIMRLMVWKC